METKDFKTQLKQSGQEISLVLDSYFGEWRKKVEQIDIRLVPLMDAVIEANKGGKNLRGSLVRLGYEMFGGGDIDSINKAAAAYEIFQTAILIHDDIIDKSKLRRGKKTVYQSLGGDHYATSQAICLGDIGFFMAVNILSQADFPVESKSKAISSFTESMVETAMGEMLDVELPHTGNDYKEETVMAIYRYKTARYTIVGPLQMGAILAGVSDEILKNIKKFGDSLGIAYQIQDDILGIFGSEEQLGKSVNSDVEEGKATVLISHMMAHATEDQKQYLQDNYGKQVDDQKFEQIKEIFEKSGSLEYARTKALKYVTEAKKLIPEITKNKQYQNLLDELADFLIKREY